MSACNQQRNTIGSRLRQVSRLVAFLLIFLFCALQVEGVSSSGADISAVETDPTPFLTHDLPIYRWHIDDGFIYYCIYRNALLRRAFSGTEDVALAQICQDVDHFASDNGAVYYYDSNSQQIETIAVDQPAAEPSVLYSLSYDDIVDLDTQGNYVYWIEEDRDDIEGSRTVIRRAPKGGGGATTLVETGNPKALALSDSYLYWTAAGGLRRQHLPAPICSVTPEGCPVELLHSQLNTASNLHVNDDDFVSWWATAYDGLNHLLATNCNVSCTTFEPSYDDAPAGSAIHGMTHDGTAIFFMEGGRLRRVDRITFQVTTLAEGLINGSPLQRIDDALFFLMENDTIGTLGTDADPIVRDFQLLGLEVNQSIQNVNNDVALIAGKSTTVRVYGQILTGDNVGAAEAILHGYDENGVEFPDSPLYPLQRTRTINGQDLSQRDSPTYGWFFQLPRAWINPSGEAIPQEDSALYLRPVLDPRELLEDSNRANNTMPQAQRLDLIAKAPTCIHMRPVWTERGTLDLYGGNVSATVALTERMLPTANILIFRNSDPLQDYLYNLQTAPIPYDLSTRASILLSRLGNQDFWSSFPGECVANNARTLSAGMVHPAAEWESDVGSTAGLARIGGDQLISMVPYPGGAGDLGVFWDSGPRTATTLAHEMGHNYDRKHIACSGNEANGGEVDSDYPYGMAQGIDNGSLSDRGTHFGLLTGTNRVMDADGTQDVMGYCGKRWISDYTYTAIFDNTRGPIFYPPFAPRWTTDSQIAFIAGIIDREHDEAILDPVFQYPIPLANQRQHENWYAQMAPAEETDTSTTIRVLDDQGAVVATEPLTLTETSDHQSHLVPFSAVTNWPEGAVGEVQILDGERVLGALRAGSATPSLSLIAPAGGESVDNTLLVRFWAEDHDAGDALVSTVQYSPDGGESWHALLVNEPLQGGWEQRTLDLSELPGSDGESALLRLFVSDGLHTANATSEPFTVSRRPPTAVIISPGDSAYLPADSPIALSGKGYDAEDLLVPAEHMSWEVNGRVTNGPDAYLSGMAPGFYEARLAVSDSDGQSDEASVSFVVNPLMIAENHLGALNLDGHCSDTAYAQVNELPLERYADGSQAAAYVTRTTTDLWLCVGGLAPGDGEASLLMDIDHSGGATPQPGDARYFVRHDGTPGMEVVESGEYTALPLEHMVARIVSGDLGWSAEFRIEADAFGGWQKQVGLSVIHSNAEADGAVPWPMDAAAGVPDSWATFNLSASPLLSSVQPFSLTLGTGDVVLRVFGNDFDDNTQIVWNGAAIATTFVSSQEVTGVIDTDVLTSSGQYPLAVIDAAIPDISSPPLTLTVHNPVPVLEGIEPESVEADGTDQNVVVSGSHFVDGATLFFNGKAIPTELIDANTMNAVIPAAQLEGLTAGILTAANSEFSLHASNPLTIDIIPSPVWPHPVYLPMISLH